MATSRSTALKGYEATYASSGRKKYNFHKAIRQYKKTGFFKVRKDGSGHDAGYKWGEAKQIDPESRISRYGKNSPSFDEGVYAYKQSSKSKALQK